MRLECRHGSGSDSEPFLGSRAELVSAASQCWTEQEETSPGTGQGGGLELEERTPGGSLDLEPVADTEGIPGVDSCCTLGNRGRMKNTERCAEVRSTASGVHREYCRPGGASWELHYAGCPCLRDEGSWRVAGDAGWRGWRVLGTAALMASGDLSDWNDGGRTGCAGDGGLGGCCTDGQGPGTEEEGWG